MYYEKECMAEVFCSVPVTDSMTFAAIALIIYIALLGKFSRKKGMGKYEHKKYENNETLM